MANLQERAGSVVVRLGGNTQEYAKMVDSIPDGNTFMTDLQGTVRFDLFLPENLFLIYFCLIADVDAVCALYKRYALYGLRYFFDGQCQVLYGSVEICILRRCSLS